MKDRRKNVLVPIVLVCIYFSYATAVNAQTITPTDTLTPTATPIPTTEPTPTDTPTLTPTPSLYIDPLDYSTASHPAYIDVASTSALAKGIYGTNMLLWVIGIIISLYVGFRMATWYFSL